MQPGGRLSAADELPAPKLAKAQTADDDAPIKQLVAAYVHAFNAGDAAAIADLWAADAEYVAEDGTATKGKAALADMFKKLFAGEKGSKMALATKSTRMLTPEVAMTDGRVEVTSAAGDKDASHFHAVAVRKDGRWLLHTVRDLPTSGEEAESPSLRGSSRWPGSSDIGPPAPRRRRSR